MAYQAPTISAAGLETSGYTDILNQLLTKFLSIYGTSNYLNPVTPDYQFMAALALQYADLNGGLSQVNAQMNPLFAVGINLDNLGQLIGTPRKLATFSTAQLTVSGTPGTVITVGVVSDSNGNLWSLPAQVVIGSGGTVSVTATCQSTGAVSAPANTITNIQTPTKGWNGVTNAAAAIVGQPVEPDSLYRARLVISQALPSLTGLAGTVAAIAAVPGVTRSTVYENYNGYTASFGYCSTSGTSVTNLTGYPFDSTMDGQTITINGTGYTVSSVSGGVITLGSSAGSQTNVPFSIGGLNQLGPKNSITAVVEGGTSAAIAQAIYNNRGIGPLTNGTTSVTVTDPSNGNLTLSISFDILAYLQIYVAANIHGLTGFTTAILNNIQSDIVTYLNDLEIGEAVIYSSIYGAALEAQPNPLVPAFSIRSLTIGFLAATTTASTSSSSANITVASATGIAIGQVCTGANIPANTTVTGVSGTTITLSADPTTTTGAAPVQFWTVGSSDIQMLYNLAAQSVAANVVLTMV